MILIVPDLIPKRLCKEIINVHDKNHDLITKYNDTRCLDMNVLEDDDYKIVKKYALYLERYFSQFYPKCFIEYVQIVKWPPGASMDTHYDDARPTTSLVSITTLNDDFSGGEHFIQEKKEKLEFIPETGKTLAFDGMKYLHGVREVTRGTRYTLAIWYTNDLEASINYS